MSKKISIPKNRARFEACLINTFIAGCNFGYGVKHDHKKEEQEMLGALAWVGKITKEEAYEELLKIWNERI